MIITVICQPLELAFNASPPLVLFIHNQIPNPLPIVFRKNGTAELDLSLALFGLIVELGDPLYSYHYMKAIMWDLCYSVFFVKWFSMPDIVS